MLQTDIITVPRENGKLQRVQVVRGTSWDAVHFIRPKPDPAGAFRQLVSLYRGYHVARYPFLYGQLVFFRLTKDIPVPGMPEEDGEARLARAAEILRDGMRIRHETPCFSTEEAEYLYSHLTRSGLVNIVCGKRRKTCILPVGDQCGFLTDGAIPQGVTANLSFFLMDPFDCASPYDVLGIPIGLQVRGGSVLSLPQYGRPMLLVKNDGTVLITENVRDERIDPLRYSLKGEPVESLREHLRVFPPLDGKKDIVTLVGKIVTSVNRGKRVAIPTSGSTVSFPAGKGMGQRVHCGDELTVSGMSDVLFGVQVGPAAVIDGIPQTALPKHFYHFTRIWENVLTLTDPYPPALYRCRPTKDRAPRMVLGADENGKPMLLWFEGAPKFGYVPERDSCGATLTEAAELCAAIGMKNGVHLDGGGSAQILVNGKRHLKISDRDPVTGEERERAVPNGILLSEN